MSNASVWLRRVGWWLAGAWVALLAISLGLRVAARAEAREQLLSGCGAEPPAPDVAFCLNVYASWRAQPNGLLYALDALQPAVLASIILAFIGSAVSVMLFYSIAWSLRRTRPADGA